MSNIITKAAKSAAFMYDTFGANQTDVGRGIKETRHIIGTAAAIGGVVGCSIAMKNAEKEVGIKMGDSFNESSQLFGLNTENTFDALNVKKSIMQENLIDNMSVKGFDYSKVDVKKTYNIGDNLGKKTISTQTEADLINHYSGVKTAPTFASGIRPNVSAETMSKITSAEKFLAKNGFETKHLKEAIEQKKNIIKNTLKVSNNSLNKLGEFSDRKYSMLIADLKRRCKIDDKLEKTLDEYRDMMKVRNYHSKKDPNALILNPAARAKHQNMVRKHFGKRGINLDDYSLDQLKKFAKDGKMKIGGVNVNLNNEDMVHLNAYIGLEGSPKGKLLALKRRFKGSLKMAIKRPLLKVFSQTDVGRGAGVALVGYRVGKGATKLSKVVLRKICNKTLFKIPRVKNFNQSLVDGSQRFHQAMHKDLLLGAKEKRRAKKMVKNSKKAQRKIRRQAMKNARRKAKYIKHPRKKIFSRARIKSKEIFKKLVNPFKKIMAPFNAIKEAIKKFLAKILGLLVKTFGVIIALTIVIAVIIFTIESIVINFDMAIEELKDVSGIQTISNDDAIKHVGSNLVKSINNGYNEEINEAINKYDKKRKIVLALSNLGASESEIADYLAIHTAGENLLDDAETDPTVKDYWDNESDIKKDVECNYTFQIISGDGQSDYTRSNMSIYGGATATTSVMTKNIMAMAMAYYDGDFKKNNQAYKDVNIDGYVKNLAKKAIDIKIQNNVYDENGNLTDDLIDSSNGTSSLTDSSVFYHSDNSTTCSNCQAATRTEAIGAYCYDLTPIDKYNDYQTWFNCSNSNSVNIMIYKDDMENSEIACSYKNNGLKSIKKKKRAFVLGGSGESRNGFMNLNDPLSNDGDNDYSVQLSRAIFGSNVLNYKGNTYSRMAGSTLRDEIMTALKKEMGVKPDNPDSLTYGTVIPGTISWANQNGRSLAAKQFSYEVNNEQYSTDGNYAATLVSNNAVGIMSMDIAGYNLDISTKEKGYDNFYNYLNNQITTNEDLKNILEKDAAKIVTLRKLIIKYNLSNAINNKGNFYVEDKVVTNGYDGLSDEYRKIFDSLMDDKVDEIYDDIYGDETQVIYPLSRKGNNPIYLYMDYGAIICRGHESRLVSVIVYDLGQTQLQAKWGDNMEAYSYDGTKDLSHSLGTKDSNKANKCLLPTISGEWGSDTWGPSIEKTLFGKDDADDGKEHDILAGMSTDYQKDDNDNGILKTIGGGVVSTVGWLGKKFSLLGDKVTGEDGKNDVEYKGQAVDVIYDGWYYNQNDPDKKGNSGEIDRKYPILEYYFDISGKKVPSDFMEIMNSSTEVNKIKETAPDLLDKYNKILDLPENEIKYFNKTSDQLIKSAYIDLRNNARNYAELSGEDFYETYGINLDYDIGTYSKVEIEQILQGYSTTIDGQTGDKSNVTGKYSGIEGYSELPSKQQELLKSLLLYIGAFYRSNNNRCDDYSILASGTGSCSDVAYPIFSYIYSGLIPNNELNDNNVSKYRILPSQILYKDENNRVTYTMGDNVGEEVVLNKTIFDIFAYKSYLTTSTSSVKEKAVDGKYIVAARYDVNDYIYDLTHISTYISENKTDSNYTSEGTYKNYGTFTDVTASVVGDNWKNSLKPGDIVVCTRKVRIYTIDNGFLKSLKDDLGQDILIEQVTGVFTYIGKNRINSNNAYQFAYMPTDALTEEDQLGTSENEDETVDGTFGCFELGSLTGNCSSMVTSGRTISSLSGVINGGKTIDSSIGGFLTDGTRVKVLRFSNYDDPDDENKEEEKDKKNETSTTVNNISSGGFSEFIANVPKPALAIFVIVIGLVFVSYILKG